MGQAPLVPAHLRKYVVEQDYGQYTEVDHAVWRFVLLQTYTRLQHTAHAAYRTGLSATGISIDRIPRVDEMNEKLSRFGWGAVCVDGFIPPRAFQGFQANRILPIAAEMRTVEHLRYTPAPDIIHEAAGHAPILSEPAYAAFLQEIGAVSVKAFATPSDRALYEKIHTLSEVQENPWSTPTQVEHARKEFDMAIASVMEVSESARMARLYWWTAEYGLIGNVDKYALYGAGLLSSLGESTSCHDASVRKVPLSADCVNVDYDITRPQPQLFVAKNFEQLLDVLEEVGTTLAYRGPVLPALEIARHSDEVATLKLDTGIDVVGIVVRFERFQDQPAWVQLKGTPALYATGTPGELPRCPAEYLVALGHLENGQSLSELTLEKLRSLVRDDELDLRLRSGVRIQGKLRKADVAQARVVLALLERLELSLPNGSVFRSQAPYPLALAERITCVEAGAPDAYFGQSELSRVRVPAPRWYASRERELLSLYEQAIHAWRDLAGSAMVNAFEHIAKELDAQFPDDWLLRWNLLESLVKVTEGEPLTQALIHKLERLEIQYLHKEPIATGLSTIRAMIADDDVRAESPAP